MPDRSAGVQQGREQDWTKGIPVETVVHANDVLHIRGSDWLRVRRELNELRAVSPEPREGEQEERDDLSRAIGLVAAMAEGEPRPLSHEGVRDVAREVVDLLVRVRAGGGT